MSRLAPAPGKGRLPAEALKFAKRLGVDLNGFEFEAEELWRKLDDMAVNKPVEYQAFVDQQYAAQMAEEAMKAEGSLPAGHGAGHSKNVSSSSKKPSPADEAARYFRPDVGFCIKTKTTGRDGLKIRAKGEGKILYINFCSHLAVDLPMDSFGTKVMNYSSANGLSVPLVVGPLRDLEDRQTNQVNESTAVIIPHSLAIDVVFHVSVTEACLQKPGFKSQIISLAFDWITKEAGVEFSFEWKDCKSKYSGGLGENGDIPVLFFIDVDEHNTKMVEQQKRAEGASTASTNPTLSIKRPEHNTTGNRLDVYPARPADPFSLDNPASVLHRVRNDDGESAIDELLIKSSTVNPANSRGSKSFQAEDIAVRQPREDSRPAQLSESPSDIDRLPKKSSLIKDLSETAASHITESQDASKTSKKEPAIKKGFLNGSNAGKLYPKGSNEGAGTGKGGSLARVMSKCQVVDTATGKSSGPLGNGDYGSMAPTNGNVASASDRINTPKPAAAKASVHTSINPPKPPVSKPSQFEIDELDRIMSSMDEEFKAGSRESGDTLTDESINDAFGNLAKILLGPAPDKNAQPGLSMFNQYGLGSGSNNGGRGSDLKVDLFDHTTKAASVPAPLTIVASPPLKVDVEPSISVACSQLPAHINVAATISAEDNSDKPKAVIIISGLQSTVFKVSAADISVTSTVIKVSMPTTITQPPVASSSLVPATPCSSDEMSIISASLTKGALDAASVTASYAKKKGVLTITASLTK
jgi:hypothetical protein